VTDLDPCVQCRGVDGDAELRRVQVWEDDLWRVATVLSGQVSGLSFLEPKRHIPHIEDLDGREAETFGGVLAQTARALKDATRAERVYVHVFGSASPHLHVHLEPHLAHTPPGGQCAGENPSHPGSDEAERQRVVKRIRERLSHFGGQTPATVAGG
jgi:diadenosine tetraphosphate (Ap4A) HIT family hydrolase